MALGLLIILALPGWVQEKAKKEHKEGAPTPLPVEDALRKARVEGKYQMLLRQIKVPKDFDKHGEFHEGTLRDTTEYAGFTELPHGYWVYVYPYWYIWRERAADPKPKRGWGPEQLIGVPDTPEAGDIQTAWASQTPDGQDEWLLLEYAEPVVPRSVLIYETYNPGAVNRVTVFNLAGEEVEAWQGTDPTPINQPKGISVIPIRVGFKTNRVKIYLDSKAVAGWNEIDAVGLRDSHGKTQWVRAAEASSTFAQPVVAPALAPAPAPAAAPAPAPAPAVRDAKDKRIQELEKEVQELKKTIRMLEEKLKKK